MQIKSTANAKLAALTKNGQIIKIRNQILRKPMSLKSQDKKLPPHSVCITCNYIFKDRVFEWSKNVEAICHPFRSDSMFPSDKVKVLLSESDFCDQTTSPTKAKSSRTQYDFVYFTIDSMQGIECKGLYLLQAIDQSARMSGLNGLVVNYGTEEYVRNAKKHQNHPRRELLERARSFMNNLSSLTMLNKELSGQTVCDVMKSARFVLFPNTKDASPRLIPEAIIRGTPVLVNESIYGGWKYVNEHTGRFFNAPSADVYMRPDWLAAEREFVPRLASAMKGMLDIDRNSITKNYYENFGFANSAKRLAKIVNTLQGTDYLMVSYRQHTKSLKMARDAI